MITYFLFADGYTFRELIFEWMDGGAALEFSSDMELPEFLMKKHEFGYCTRIYFTGKIQSDTACGSIPNE
jgi:hypothetical protein